jgi:hypothetical protein
MKSDPFSKQNLQGKMQQHEGVEPNAGDHSKPADVPVFSCIVYLSRDAGGGVLARVANLPGLGCTAASEREALGKIVSAFKQRVGELMHGEAQIPWIEPPTPAEPWEQKRFIPVHL